MKTWAIKYWSILAWLALTVGLSGYCYYLFFEAEDKSALLPGHTTDGHHQIEMQCSACHTDEKKENVFTSSGVPSSACMNCHSEALNKFSDSHPVRKFKNPENAIFTDKIDALRCVTCHQEHNRKVTSPMGVTIPNDFCAHCHQVTLENLDSHRDLAFDTCATAGCHNYHDNTPLAPSFLLKHYGEQKMIEDPKLPALTATGTCTDPWTSAQSCASCHNDTQHEFKQGKHGMRSAFENLSSLKVEMARATMKDDAAHLTMDCTACHKPDKPREFASYQACMQCHDDEHSRNYEGSKHHSRWLAGGDDAGVSCASCHMPRIDSEEGGYHVSHDNTANLRPNEKMIRSSCAHCHGLQFSMNALADEALIQSNFKGHPAVTHPGMEWAADSAISRGDEDIIELRKYLQSLSPENKTKTE